MLVFLDIDEDTAQQGEKKRERERETERSHTKGDESPAQTTGLFKFPRPEDGIDDFP